MFAIRRVSMRPDPEIRIDCFVHFVRCTQIVSINTRIIFHFDSRHSDIYTYKFYTAIKRRAFPSLTNLSLSVTAHCGAHHHPPPSLRTSLAHTGIPRHIDSEINVSSLNLIRYSFFVCWFCFQIFALPWTPMSPKLNFQMLEEQPIGTKLTTLQATDADSNIEAYRLSSNDFFDINNLTGLYRHESKTQNS